MVEPKKFIGRVRERGINFFTGVPDSLLKDLCAYITDNSPTCDHVIATNEGAAVGLATGNYLATGEAALVYMQNSGTGNAINPLVSLADPDVYAIPMLLVIGWRGEPGVLDEPQHLKQGHIQESLIAALGFPFEIMDQDESRALVQLDRMLERMHTESGPVILLVRKGGFAPYHMSNSTIDPYPMSREEAIMTILDTCGEDDRIVSTTGMASREIYEIREAVGLGHAKDFLTVGSMGHAVMIASGLAAKTSRRIWCIDGDGAALMHLGSLALAAARAPSSFRHIIINNGAHDSVGGQPTLGYSLPFSDIALNLGYRTALRADDLKTLRKAMSELDSCEGPAFLEVRVRRGARKDLGRPKTSPIQNKKAFMEEL